MVAAVCRLFSGPLFSAWPGLRVPLVISRGGLEHDCRLRLCAHAPSQNRRHAVPGPLRSHASVRMRTAEGETMARYVSVVVDGVDSLALRQKARLRTAAYVILKFAHNRGWSIVRVLLFRLLSCPDT